ncbi:PREDICTED: histone-lysine N-methyltransferase eggless-like isoform X2 [Papilio polytes]|uniref:histone-lysine N-methyltransferase eggless-like isoform X2 n=1 Tax=Papilio polytes TaxID=76194 RepID=UPI0006763E31|nr:PREDICTED: histone-lysine N-methyltransferase eggless-like isoform X2 [Papilio polytes]
MDITDNSGNVPAENNFEKDSSHETKEDLTSQNAENREEETTPKSTNLDDILIHDANDKSKDIKEMFVKELKSHGEDVQIAASNQKVGDGVVENYLKSCVKTDAVITSTNIIPEISSINKSLMEYLDTSDNDVKSNIADVLDEELQLRWDDDENDGDNVIDSADEESLLRENTDTCEIVEKEGTDTKDLDDNVLTEEKLDAITSASTHEDIKALSIDSIQRIEEIVTQHGLKKPDMMLEIPSQELMDFMDEDDEPDLLSHLDILPNIEKGENSPKVEKDGESNDLKTCPLNTCDAELKLDNVESQATEIVQVDSEESENLINADVKESIEKNKAEVLTNTMSKDIDMDPIQPKDDAKELNIDITLDEPQPSTSKASVITEIRRDSDEVGEMSDTLGLLAESTRVVEDDEDQDDDDEDDDGEDDDGDDDDEEYDPDEENSNQMAVEYSEDSNAVNSDLDTAKVVSQSEEQDDKVPQTDLPLIDEQNEICEFTITNVVSQEENKDVETTEQMETDVTMVEVEENDKNMEEVGEKMIIDKEVEPIDRELSQSATSDIDNGAEVLNKPEESEKGVFVIDENIVILNEAQSPSVSEPVTKKDENIVLLESSSEDEKENTSNNQPEKVELSKKSTESKSVSPSKEKSTEIVEAMDTEISSPQKEKKKVSKVPIGLEVFNVDSDEDEVEQNVEVEAIDVENPAPVQCVNPKCQSLNDTKFYAADADMSMFYKIEHKKKAAVCEACANLYYKHLEDLLNKFKNFTPLLDLDTGKNYQDVVHISDSESDEDEESNKKKIGASVAKFLEDNLADVFNATWDKYKMDSRIAASEKELEQELNKLQVQTKVIDKMIKDCQAETDKIRSDLYAKFEVERKALPAICIVDTPTTTYCCYEDTQVNKVEPPQTRSKRRLMTNTDTPAKRIAVPTPDKNCTTAPETNDDDNVDVSVVKLSAEVAPADLPPPGDVIKPPLRVGMPVYAMKSTFGLWVKAKIIEVMPRTSSTKFTNCRVKIEYKTNKNVTKHVTGRCLAYSEPPDVRLIIGTRIIACAEQTDSFYSGVVAEVPNPVNKFRYLVFFDDGHAKYVQHANTRLVCECSQLVWEEVHPYSQEFVRQYLLSYPERPMVRLRPKQHVKAEWQGRWWSSEVAQVDASLAEIVLAGKRREWIYRGSTRLAPLYLELQAAERQRARPMPRSGHHNKSNMPYVEYTRYDEPSKSPTESAQQVEELRRLRFIAKKSTATSQPPPIATNKKVSMEKIVSRVVHYKPKNAVCPLAMVAHECGPQCRRGDVLPLSDLRTYNPLTKPLLSGWQRQIVRYKATKIVMYRAPCGRRLRDMHELHRYLRAVRSDMPVDLFDFSPATQCLAEFVLQNCIVAKKDLSHGKENMPVPCMNYYDDSLPEFCSYNTERTPTAGVPLNLDPDFLCGCDCEDDCADKNKCACWKMTIEGARTIGIEGDVGYVYRRLPEPLLSGIYECNSRCKCNNTCLNRVAQHPLQLKLQVFKTEQRGWGIRALNDVPKGAFLCVYAGNLLTDATANLDGLNEGDEYLAELDYIEVVEAMKEGYEEDVPESLKENDQKSGSNDSSEEEESSEEEKESKTKTSKDEDDDFCPSYVELPLEFNKRLRTRERRKKEKQDDSGEQKQKEKETEKEMKKESKKEADNCNGDEECITIISDDEEVREPSRFTVQAGMDSKQLVSKYRSVRSYFGEDEACYIMDAKVQGNIGRYLNHSCCPNVFVQNVFVDTHDPRFPWVAFFASSHIRAGTELTWNYNYDIGSVPGKLLYCYCGSDNCRGRLL